MSNLVILDQITKEEFLTARMSQECKKGETEPLDTVAVCTLLKHCESRGQSYHVAMLTEEGFRNLIIAHHKHGDWLVVSEGGESLEKIAKKYTGEHPVEANECWEKVHVMMDIIAQELLSSGNVFPQEMMPFVSDVGELAIAGMGHYDESKHGPQNLYVGGYHRFAAYGLWVREHGFQPLRLYYCEVKGTAR